MPISGVTWLLDQILQVLRIRTVVHFVHAESGFDSAIDIGESRLLARFLTTTDNLRDDEGRKDADDGDNEQNFHEGEPAVESGFLMMKQGAIDFHNFFII